MKQLSLEEIKKIELEILIVFDEFCKKNNIQYFLSNGTLLGAVKYKGFIPWDDDIDVFVPRKDYGRLIQLFEDTEKYKLFSFERNKKYAFPYAKLCDTTTLKKETNTNNGVELGLDMDIFPLDAWASEKDRAVKEVKSISRWMFFLQLSKLEKADSENFAKRQIKRLTMLGCKLLGSRFFIKKIVYKSKKNQNEEGAFLGCKSWCIYGEREIIPSDVFSETTEIFFEGRSFPAPAGYDTYLCSLYGDYRRDPPVEKQKTHHNYVAYSI